MANAENFESVKLRTEVMDKLRNNKKEFGIPFSKTVELAIECYFKKIASSKRKSKK